MGRSAPAGCGGFIDRQTGDATAGDRGYASRGRLGDPGRREMPDVARNHRQIVLKRRRGD